MSEEIVEIMGIPFAIVDNDEALERTIKYTTGSRLRLIFTPNPEIVMLAQEDEELYKALNTADMLIPDGIGIVMVSALFGHKLTERVAGFDLTSHMFKIGEKKGWTFFFLGGAEGIVDKAAENLKKKYPRLRIVGKHHGFISGKEEEVIKQINNVSPTVLLVGMGAPMQEKWLFRNRGKLDSKIAMGIGGSFDIFAGKSKRAPKIFIKLGLEWLYRLIKEPWRFKRMMILPVFLFKAIVIAITNALKIKKK